MHTPKHNRLRSAAIMLPVMTLGVAAPNISAAVIFSADKSETYKSGDGYQLSMYFNHPQDWSPNDHRPVLVLFFSGGWNHSTMALFQPQAEYFASRGLVVARPDYRVKNVGPDACVEDARSAVRWLRTNANRLGIDGDKVIVGGSTSGAHIAACTMIKDCVDSTCDDMSVPTKPQAMVLISPVLDFVDEEKIALVKGTKERIMAINRDPVLARKISPILHLASDTPPALLLCGTKDKLFVFSHDYWTAADALGVRADRFILEGKGHSFHNHSPYREEVIAAIDRFLASLGYLEGDPTIEVDATSDDDNETGE